MRRTAFLHATLALMLATARKRSIAAPVLEIAATHLEAYAARRVREAAGK